MQFAQTVFPEGLLDAVKALNLSTEDYKVLLLDNTYVYDDTDHFVSDLSGDEHDGAGYSRQALSNVTVAVNSGRTGIVLDADNVTFTALAAGTNDVRHAVIYVDTTVDSTSPVLCLLTLDSDYEPDGVADFVIAFANAGIFSIVNP